MQLNLMQLFFSHKIIIIIIIVHLFQVWSSSQRSAFMSVHIVFFFQKWIVPICYFVPHSLYFNKVLANDLSACIANDLSAFFSLFLPWYIKRFSALWLWFFCQNLCYLNKKRCFHSMLLHVLPDLKADIIRFVTTIL